MRRTLAIFTLSLILMTATTFAQNELIEYKAGHTFTISLPDYMSKTGGLNVIRPYNIKTQ